MKLNASTAIALALAFTSVAGNPVAVYASSVSEDSPRLSQRSTPENHREYEARQTGCIRVGVLRACIWK